MNNIKSNVCELTNYNAEDFGIMIDSGIVLKKAVCWLHQKIKQHKSNPTANEAQGYVFVSAEAKKQCDYFESLSIPKVILYKTASEEYQEMEKRYKKLATLFGDNIMHFVGLHYPADADVNKFYTKDVETQKSIIGSLYSNALDCYFVSISDKYKNSGVYPLGFILEYAEDVLTPEKKAKIKEEVLGSLVRMYTVKSGTENIVDIPHSHLTALADAKGVFDKALENKGIYKLRDKGKKRGLVFPAIGKSACDIGIKQLVWLGLSALFCWAVFAAICGYCVSNRETIVSLIKHSSALFNGTSSLWLSTVTAYLAVILLAVTLAMLVWLRPFYTLYKTIPLYQRAKAMRRIMGYNKKRPSKKISLSLAEGATEISDIIIIRGESFTKTYTKAFSRYEVKDCKYLARRMRYSYPAIAAITVFAFCFLANKIFAYELSRLVSSLW